MEVSSSELPLINDQTYLVQPSRKLGTPENGFYLIKCSISEVILIPGLNFQCHGHAPL